MRVLSAILLPCGLALAGTGLAALFSLATGWELRTRGPSPIVLEAELDFALVFLAAGMTCLGLGWLLGRRR